MNRKRMILNPRLQLTVIGSMIGITIVSISFFYLANSYFFKAFLERGKVAGLSEKHIFFIFLQDQQTEMKKIFLITAFVATVINLAVGIILSHRIAGPIYRFTQTIREAKRTKNLAAITFRKNDYFEGLEDDWNSLVEIIANDIKKNLTSKKKTKKNGSEAA